MSREIEAKSLAISRRHALAKMAASSAGPALAHPLFATRNRDGLYAFGPRQPHVIVSNVTITGSRYGIALFMQDGGIYEDNRFSNLIIETGGRHAREYPIFVDIDSRQPDSLAVWGRIRGLSFDGIDIKTRGNILIQGQPEHDVEELRVDGQAIAACVA
jgi:hypothetical protein